MSVQIPKILHQIWIGSSPPARFATWRERWIALHPGWEHRFYDDDGVRKAVRDRAPHLLQVFETLGQPVLRADLFRFVVMHLDGGLYADFDMKPYLPSDPLLSGSSCVLSVEAQLGPQFQQVVGYPQPWQLASCIFAAAPGHPFFAELIDHVARRAAMPLMSDDDVEELAGPRALTRLFYRLPAERRGEMRVLPQIHWLAPWVYPRVGPLSHRIHARHASAGSWRFATPWSRLTVRNRFIARARFPNPFVAEGPVVP